MRGANQHLSGEEIEQLTGIATDVAVGALEGAMRHLERCEQCRFRMLTARDLSGEPLEGTGGARAGNSPCPPEARWLEVAAGLGTEAERKRHIEHAASCARCGPLLKQAVEDIGMELSPEEETKVAALSSAQPDWQSNLARKIADSAPPKVPLPEKPASSSKKFVFLPRWAVTFAALILAGGGGWWTWFLLRAPSVETLFAQAYTEQRTIEMRIQGAAYAPQYAKRGSQESRADRAEALLQAEPLVAKQLRLHPDDAQWLHAQGLVDLLEGNYTAAITNLEKADKLEPNNAQISIDLASAYYVRGEQTDRKEDYGTAVQLLGVVISKHPESQVAIFNRAIAEEPIGLYKNAEDDWLAFLKLDGSSSWADEARRRLAEVEQQLQQNKDRSSKPLLRAEELASRFARGQQNDMMEIDGRIERYFDLAIQEWIPTIFSGTSADTKDVLIARRATEAVAALLIERHQDWWLKDFLRELDQSPLAHSDAQNLSDAAVMNDGTKREVLFGIENRLKRTGDWAGEMRALFESARADQLAHHAERCEAEARDLLQRRQITSYPWLRIQGLLELSACASLGDESARAHAEEALKRAQSHGFGSLKLRAMTFVGDLYRIIGDSKQAWRYTTDGLRQYWAGDYPAMRGYSLYTNLDHLAEENQQWFLDVAILQEALATIATDRHFSLQAVEHQHLAQALVLTGDLSAAETNFHITEELFRQSAPGEWKTSLQAEVQIGLAGIDLLQNQPNKVISRLAGLWPSVEQMRDKDIEFDFLRTLGLAYLRAGDQRAEETLSSAVALAEYSLHTNRSEPERFRWSHKTEPVYRAMVQLKVRSSPAQAFSRWEWYKASSLRGPNTRLNGRQLTGLSPEIIDASVEPAVSADTAVISYAFFPETLVIWIYDREGLHQSLRTISESEIESLARVFGEHCTDPNFDGDALKREGQKLYQEIFAPMESLLAHRQHLVIEPDGALGLIPFEALVDGSGAYLGDRWTVSLSPGLYYLAYSRPWSGVSRQSRALVVQVPSSGSAGQFSAIDQEARSISELFPNHWLLRSSQATFATITQWLAESDIFHFAGHAVASASGVGLILGDSSLLNVERLDQSAFDNLQLVVLSACSTAVGSNGVFDERESLARLLVGAGIPEVVASRWVVSSEATKVLMEDLYRELLDGKKPADALHQSVVNLRATRREFTHPYYWAGFAVFGRG
ncbi:MAG TPA: CHAT domain-containing protein [Candidatus Angelobacter sp.]